MLQESAGVCGSGAVDEGAAILDVASEHSNFPVAYHPWSCLFADHRLSAPSSCGALNSRSVGA